MARDMQILVYGDWAAGVVARSSCRDLRLWPTPAGLPAFQLMLRSLHTSALLPASLHRAARRHPPLSPASLLRCAVWLQIRTARQVATQLATAQQQHSCILVESKTTAGGHARCVGQRGRRERLLRAAAACTASRCLGGSMPLVVRPRVARMHGLAGAAATGGSSSGVARQAVGQATTPQSVLVVLHARQHNACVPV